MGSGNQVVVDVSSDEEVEDYYSDWLNDLSSDSTDVVEFVAEVKGGVDSQPRKPKPLDDDDDCVILDGDPDQKTTKTSAALDDDGEEVLVVGQKGEIACRDFPHPRHSCAKYSFTSTSHDKYCHMCHCYVCDIPAPCPYWSVAVSSIDHCHANDKEIIWKNQREFFRTGTMPTQPSVKPNPLPPSIRPCSSSTRAANLSNVRARHTTSPHSRGLQSLISGRSNLIRKDRSSYIGNNLRSAYSGARYGGANGKLGLHTSAKVSQSTHHISSLVAPPTITAEMYNAQQHRRPQLNLPDYRAAPTGSQSIRHTQHSGQSKSVGGSCQFPGLFAQPETPLIARGLQAQTVQQQPPGTKDNVLQTKLSEVESWLMDTSNQAGLVSPLLEPVGEDNDGPLTFDFETFLNDRKITVYFVRTQLTVMGL